MRFLRIGSTLFSVVALVGCTFDGELPSVPGKPSGVVAAAGDSQATVNWQAPTDPGSSPILSYIVTTQPGGTTALATGLRLVVTGLTNGTAYTFTVRATNATGSGADSAPSEAVTPTAAPAAPGAPTQAIAVAGDAQATVSWTAPEKTGGSPITGYTVTTTPGGQTTSTTNTSAVTTNLTNGTAYTFTVHATNALGDGPESPPTAPVIPHGVEVTAPDAPTNVVATPGNAQATITWTAPANTGGSEITGYTVTATPSGLTASTTGATTAMIAGLVNGTAYTFTVHATNIVGSGAESAPSSAVTPATIPGAPTEVVALAGDGQASVSWHPPADDGGSAVLSYSVTITPGGTTETTTETSLSFSGLLNGTGYSFSVTATNAVGTGAAATSNTVTPVAHLVVPGAPSAVTAERGNASAKVSWTAPQIDGGSSITGYTVTATPGGATATTPGDTTATISGLTNGTSYTFTVVATNAVGNGPASQPSNAVIPATLASAPTNVQALAGNASATVTWTASIDDGGSPIIGYVVTVEPGGLIVASDTTSVTVEGLTNGAPYTFSVHAVNDVGDGVESEVTSPVVPVTVPGAPNDVVATPGDGTAFVTWMAPVNDGGSAITGYRITASTGGIELEVGVQTSATITGLTNGTSYSFTVKALNVVGPGEASAASNVVTPVRALELPGVPTDIVAVAGDAQATVSFVAPANDGGSEIMGYVVTTYPGGVTTTVSGLSATIGGLTNGGSYTFTVRAQNAVGLGPESVASNAITPIGLPGAPTQVVAVAGEAQSSVSWLPPANDGGSTITLYSVTILPGEATVTTVDTSAIITGLTNGVGYAFTVHATNALGDGPESDPSNEVLPATLPGAPSGVTAVPSNGSASVSWTAPVSNGGSAITGYLVLASPGSASATTDGATTVDLTGLANGTAYTFTVLAINAQGTGPASEPSAAITPRTVPSAPLSASATPHDGSATVTWTAPASDGGNAISGYTVTSTPGGATITTASTSAEITGLENGTSYTFAVHATNAAGDGPNATSNAVTPAMLPGAPTSPFAVAGSTQATVFWTAPATDGGSAITSYVVTASPGGATKRASGTSVVFGGLTNGATYTFTVHAVNAIGAGPESVSTSTVYPGAHTPGAPTNVRVGVGYGEALITWDAPLDDGGAPILNYYVRSSPGPFFAITDGTTLSTPISVNNGTTYTFTVFATNAVGSGPTSAPSRAVTPGSLPGVPQNVNAFAGSGTVTLSWTAPDNDGGATISSYTVTTSPGGDTFTTADTTLTIDSLTNGTSYTFTVHATTAVGDSQESAPSNAVTPAGLPGTPTILSVTPGDGEATITFAPPESDGGSPITSYIVTADPGGVSVEVPVVSNGPSRNGSVAALTFTATITGLSNGTSYTFIVVAVNRFGSGPGGVPSSPVVPGASPSAPRNVLATAGNGQATVSWSVPLSAGDAPITRYTVTSNPGAFVGTTSGATTLTVTGLANGTSYTFTVVASNIFGSGPASSASNAVTPVVPTTPGAPTNVLAAPGNGQATISWTAPASDGGSTITGYTVTSSGGQTATTTGATTATVSGLTNGTTYTFTVTATNGAGTSVASAPSAGVVPSTVPDAPTNVSATAANAQATVSWTAPSNGGSPIQSYTVTASPGGRTATTAGTSATVTGLANGTTYTFTVKATNATGIGASSLASAGVTPNTVPGAPTNVLAVGANGQITVTWTAPTNTGTAITGYTVTSSGGQTATTTGATSATVAGLTNGTSYTFTVHATNAAGDGAESSPSSAATPSTVPGAPTGASATPGNLQATVTWTAPASNGGSPITGYTVTSSPGARTATTTGATTATVTGLANGTAYTFTVKATNANGSSAPSAATTAVTPNIVPNRPTSVLVAAGNGSVTVSWTAPSTNGGTAITGYTVTSSGGQTATTLGATSTTVTGLTNFVSYTFTVVATNAAGNSQSSVASSAAVPTGPPTVLASGQVKPWAIRVDSNSVYWTNDATAGNVMKVAKSGGTPLTIAGSRTSAYDIALDSNSIYWVEDKASGNVMKAPLGGGTLTTLVTGLASPSFLSIDTVSVYWSNYWDNSVMKVPVGGGAVTTLVTGTNGPFTVISDASKVYWTGEGASGLIRSVGLNGGAVATINSGSTQGTNGIAVDATHMYWARQDGAILKRPLAGGAYVTLATGQNLPRGVALDATSLFWANGGGSIARVPIAGGSTMTLASGLSSPNAIVVDGSTAYWTDYGNGCVMKLTYGPTVVPGTPTAPVATAGPGSATIAWRAPFDGGSVVTQYTVRSSPGGVTTTTTGATTATVTGLTSGTSYTFTVEATNTVGTGPSSVASNAVIPTALPTTPGAPTSLTITPGIAQATVSWNPPTNNGGSAIMSYTVTASPGGFTKTTGLNTVTFIELAPFTTYTFSVTATNAAGTGPAATGSTTTPAGCYSDASCGPSQICDSSGACVTPCSGSVECHACPGWEAGGACYCAANGACLNDECADTQNCTGNNIAHVCDESTRTCVQCLSDSDCPGEGSGAYCFGNSCGWCASNADCSPSRGGPYCEGLGICGEAVVPSQPTNVLAVAGVGQATVSWTAPGNNGGSAITGYTVTSTPGGFTRTTTGATNATVTGLAAGTSYTFKVTAMNAVGTGAPSVASNAVVPTSECAGGGTSCNSCDHKSSISGLPDVPCICTDSGACVSDECADSCGGRAQPQCSHLSDYQCVQCISDGDCGYLNSYGLAGPYCFGSGATRSCGGCNTNADCSAARGGVICHPAEQYDEHDWSICGPLRAPHIPYSVVATAGVRQATISWTAPADNGGSAITRYTVTSTPGGFTATTTGATSATVTGLTAGTSYTFIVKATNAVGTSSGSPASNAVVPTAPAPPSAPTAVVAVPGRVRATVSWSAPTSSGDGPITGYTVTSSPGGFTATTTGATSAIVTGLTTNVSYTFTVHATNAVGNGPESAASVAVTTRPGPVENVTAVAGPAQGEITVSWTLGPDTGGFVNCKLVPSPDDYQDLNRVTAHVWRSGPCTNLSAVFDNLLVVPHTFTVTGILPDSTGIPSTPSNEATPTCNRAGSCGAGLFCTPTGECVPECQSGDTVCDSCPADEHNRGCLCGDTGACLLDQCTDQCDGWVSACNFDTLSCVLCNVDSDCAALQELEPSFGPYCQNHSCNGCDDNSDCSDARGGSICHSGDEPWPVCVAPTVPGAPVGAQAEGGPGSATVSWVAPYYDGGSAITGYTVTSTPGGLTAMTTGATSATVTGLIAGTSYTFTVQATNALGSSVESVPSNAVVPGSACVPETMAAFCARTGAECQMAWIDNCGEDRGYASCGSDCQPGGSCYDGYCVCDYNYDYVYGRQACEDQGVYVYGVTYQFCGQEYGFNCCDSLHCADCSWESLCDVAAETEAPGYRFACGHCGTGEVCDAWSRSCRAPLPEGLPDGETCTPQCDALCVQTEGFSDCGRCNDRCLRRAIGAERVMRQVIIQASGMSMTQGRLFWSGDSSLSFLDTDSVAQVSTRRSHYLPGVDDLPSAALVTGDSTAFYSVEVDGRLVRTPLVGGGPSVLSTRTAIDFLQVENGVLFWTDVGGVYSMPATGGAVSTLASTSGHISGFVRGSGYVIWSESDTGMIVRLTDGGIPVTLAVGQTNARNLLETSTGLFWTTNDAIVFLSNAGGAPVTLASGLTGLHGFVTDGVDLYWTNGTKAVLKRAVAGGEVEILANLINPTRLWLHEQSLFADSTSNLGKRGLVGVSTAVLEIKPR